MPCLHAILTFVVFLVKSLDPLSPAEDQSSVCQGNIAKELESIVKREITAKLWIYLSNDKVTSFNNPLSGLSYIELSSNFILVR